MAKKEKQVQEQTTAEQAPTLPPPTQGLTLQDLVLVAQIIQLTSQRGAFKAEELASVGGLYNKLVAFLQSTGALTPAPDATQTEENTNA